MKLQYYAWIRERLGKPEEILEEESLTVAALLDRLRMRGGTYEYVFGNSSKFCVSVNGELLSPDRLIAHPIKRGDEITFFPPVSGG